MDELYDDLLSAGCELDNHESDLYVKDTPMARDIIGLHQCMGEKRTVNRFKSSLDGSDWLDIPFAYLPWWRRRVG